MFDVHIIDLALGEFSGATGVPLVQVPTGYGGITVVGAALTGGAGTAVAGAGTAVGALLVTMTNAGTPVISGTIGSFAGTVITKSVAVNALTLSDAFVAAGEWIGYDQTSGTIPPGAHISLSYIMGKGA